MQATSLLLVTVCLFATVYSALGMKTTYYQDGRVCDVCTEQHSSVSNGQQVYYPSTTNQRVVYHTQERIISNPSSSLSSSYVVNRADSSYQNPCSVGGSQWGPCGRNTRCQNNGGTAICSCMPGYTGSPINGCNHECESDYDCGSQDKCENFKCKSACSDCGESAECTRVVNHRAVCECPKNYFGNPLIKCAPECYGDVDCPGHKPACFYGICKNPCDGACGINADCNLQGLKPICSCPKHMTGHPFVRCRPFVPEDLCANNPCGTNAKCTPGHDNTGAERPVCTCLPGFTGNALTYCSQGECQYNSDCPPHRNCLNLQCVDPCIGQCAPNAQCEVQNHVAICKCPRGYEGDAIVSCRQARTNQYSYRTSRYYYKKK